MTAALEAAGVAEVFVARLEAGDVHEDEAAARIAAAVAGGVVQPEDPFTGRANLFAADAGLLMPDRAAIDRLNAIHPAITIATLDAFERVETGRMVATVKIIPFSAPEAAVAEAEAVARSASVVRIAPFRLRTVGVVATTLPTLKVSVLDKTRTILDERLAPTGAVVSEEVRVPHSSEALTDAIRALAPHCDCVVVFGASAIVDEADVVPASIVAAGGRIVHFGMPVDPGNLLLLADLDGVPVLGAPGCARSPRENGFDWILDRVLAGIAVSPTDVRGLGVGGLLMEIVTRPQPRREPVPAPARPQRVGAIVLAAGRSSRMGAENKLLLPVSGEPMVRHPVDAAFGAGLSPVVVVTGHEVEAVRAALAGKPVRFAHNPDFATGLSSSLGRGIAAMDDDVDAAIVLLG
ncbi:MAG: NTP transferase domain-containing protein, partial [Proteobacteria bacterium]|nr:NTP transferase domain-containing protein [Pseudomonadota bacterium]